MVSGKSVLLCREKAPLALVGHLSNGGDTKKIPCGVDN